MNHKKFNSKMVKLVLRFYNMLNNSNFCVFGNVCWETEFIKVRRSLRFYFKIIYLPCHHFLRCNLFSIFAREFQHENLDKKQCEIILLEIKINWQKNTLKMSYTNVLFICQYERQSHYSTKCLLHIWHHYANLKVPVEITKIIQS